MEKFELQAQYGTTVAIEDGFYLSISQDRNGETLSILLSIDQMERLIALAPSLIKKMKGD